jgi:HTH-type transcriptional regulator/antitoxin HigA
MIKSEKQKTKTIETINGIKSDKERFIAISAHLPKEVIEANIGSMDSMIGELEKEIQEYEEIKSGKYTLPKNISFIELLRCLPKIRIAKGLSQKDLADLLGMTKQQINRYEEHEYQNISPEKINMILEALNISLDMIEKIAA